MRFHYIMFEQPVIDPRNPPRAARGHMPFDHRSQAEIAEHESRKHITRRLGR